MLYEMTSQDVKTEFYPFQDVFVGSSREEISPSEILERWFLNFRGKPFEKPFFAIPNLSQISEIDFSSSVYNRFIKFKSETTLTEKFFKKTEHRNVLKDVSRILDKLVLEESFFREIDKKELLKTISEILNEIPIEQLEISENELCKRIRRVLILESASGILNELTPEQIKDFDEAIKRRPLFK
jgi:hypothetical protein